MQVLEFTKDELKAMLSVLEVKREVMKDMEEPRDNFYYDINNSIAVIKCRLNNVD
jgi:hypothetical protein